MTLDGLDDIDWRSLTHAYGPADDVPEVLRALASGKASAEDTASIFWGNVWHQGTVYEATAYTVPFLIELLGDEKIGDREWLLLLLRSLASGSSYLDVHGPMPNQEPQAFETARQEEKGWVSTAREAVREGIPLYLTLLSAEAPAVRTTAAYLLSEFPSEARDTVRAAPVGCLWRWTQTLMPASCCAWGCWAMQRRPRVTFWKRRCEAGKPLLDDWPPPWA